MKKSFFIMAFTCCILFAGCKKVDDESDSKEDLSYVLKTYQRYESNGHIYITTWTYDGHKPMGNQYYVDGQLISEYKNYSYDGLNASYDYYYYNNYDVNDIKYRLHVETEYLDETFQRIKYQREEYYYANSQDNYISEIYREFEEKKVVNWRRYKNGLPTAEGHDFIYDGLHCTSITTKYSSDIPNVVREETSFNTVYLDDTYLRTKSSTRANERFYEDGTSTTSTSFTVYDYDGKKPIGSQTFVNGKLSSATRDYQYDGLTCHYFYDYYINGEVQSTWSYEVEYLE